MADSMRAPSATIAASASGKRSSALTLAASEASRDSTSSPQLHVPVGGGGEKGLAVSKRDVQLRPEREP